MLQGSHWEGIVAIPVSFPFIKRDTQVADLRSPAAAAAVDLAVDDQAAADARADGDVEDRRKPLARSEKGLRESRDVGVVAQHRRPAEHLLDPRRQSEAVPALDLVRFDDGPRGVIDGAAEANADAMDLGTVETSAGEQLGDGLRDLTANALGARGDIDAAAPQPGEDAVASADAELEFGAADFDAQEHGQRRPLSRRSWFAHRACSLV